jgi:hypothetical protein
MFVLRENALAASRNTAAAAKHFEQVISRMWR